MKIFENFTQKLKTLKEKCKNIPTKKIIIIAMLALMIVITISISIISTMRRIEMNNSNPDHSQQDNVQTFNPNIDSTPDGTPNNNINTAPIIHTDERGLEFISNGNGTCYVNGFGTCELAELEIPSKSPAGDTVVKISANAFAGSDKLLTISVPSTIKTIETGAFRGCSKLVSINVDANNSVYCSIGGILFSKDKSVLLCYPANRASSSYLIPTDVKSINAYAFEGVKNLKKLLYEEGISSFQKINILIGNEVLDNMTITCNYVPAK